MGCDCSWGARLYAAKCFNPRTHMGCDVLAILFISVIGCFNPRTHMGCDSMKIYKHSSFHVSIHAPTWGATYLILINFFRKMVSIHAPTWGATKLRRTMQTNNRFQSTHPHGVRRLRGGKPIFYEQFQSTHPHGVRHTLTLAMLTILKVSIHAPTWGATAVQSDKVGADWFQSTHPHGVRRLRPSFCVHSKCFNPRTHMGCDC